MKALVVFDSMYGNTKKVAEAVGMGLKKKGKVRVVGVEQFREKDLQGVDLLVMGSPTHGGRATPKIDELMKGLGSENLQKMSVACFDTRIHPDDVGLGLKLLMKTIGYAAGKMEKAMRGRCRATLGAEGFIVSGKEGPMREGELARAEKWGKTLGEGLVTK